MASYEEQANIQLAAFEKAYASQPEVVITGVVGPIGPIYGWAKVDDMQSMTVKLIAWKDADGQLIESPLWISKKINKGREIDTVEFEKIKSAIKSESLVQLKVKVLKEAPNPNRDARARLISIMEEPVDTELTELLEKSKKPMIYKHPIFGELELSRTIDWFEGKAKWLGEDISISASLDKKHKPDSSLDTLETLFKEQKIWSKRITDFAIKNLLELKNGEWLNDGESEVTAEYFAKAMQLDSIVADPDGRFAFWHSDGDLFFGHSIEISGTLSDGPTRADIPG